MRSYNFPHGIPKISNPVITIGTFDGVHRGHQAIIKRLRQIAQSIGGETVLLTFNPHPRQVLFPDLELKIITTLDEKKELLERAGIDHVVVVPFSKEFSRTTSLEFVRDTLVGVLGVKRLVIGYNHQFGRNREGSFEELKELAPLFDFEVEEIPAQDVDHVNVSSTKIRKALAEGDIETANLYLGYEFFFSGKVIPGNGKGRTINFPTANVICETPEKILPPQGVYAVRVKIDNKILGGMLNIGTRPTVIDSTEVVNEVHVFDFEGDLYNKELRISFCKRIRDEKKFSGLDALQEQLQMDEESCRRILSHI